MTGSVHYCCCCCCIGPKSPQADSTPCSPLRNPLNEGELSINEDKPLGNKLAKLGDAIAISKSETMNH